MLHLEQVVLPGKSTCSSSKSCWHVAQHSDTETNTLCAVRKYTTFLWAGDVTVFNTTHKQTVALLRDKGRAWRKCYRWIIIWKYITCFSSLSDFWIDKGTLRLKSSSIVPASITWSRGLVFSCGWGWETWGKLAQPSLSPDWYKSLLHTATFFNLNIQLIRGHTFRKTIWLLKHSLLEE